MKFCTILLAITAWETSAELTGCVDGITCSQLTPANSGLTFDCRFAGNQMQSKGNVMLLHGFPEWSSMYMPLMRELSEKGYYSVACNQRGYSPSASPPKQEDYNYDILASDVSELASEAFGYDGKYHLIGHDHGGILGWVVASKEEEKILSYTTLSSPHPDAFSEGLYGINRDVKQVEASQYFTMFTLPDSATIHHSFWWYSAGKTASTKYGESFSSAEDFQKALWWYNGAEDAGMFAMPALLSASDLLKDGAFSAAFLRSIFGGTPNEGHPAKEPVGNVNVPTLFICGNQDESILCTRDYSKKSSDFVVDSEYDYLEVECGHDLLSSSCKEMDKIMEIVIDHVDKNM